MSHSDFKEINRFFRKAQVDLARIESSDSVADLRDSWESFLANYSRCLGRLTTVALADARTKSWGYRLKNQSNGGDEGLTYLREARNSAEHGLKPFANFKDREIRFGNAIRLSGNTDANLSNNVYIDPFGKRTVYGGEVKGGKLKSTTISGGPTTTELPPRVELRPIFSTEKKKEFPVPEHCCDKALVASSPTSLAQVALQVLADRKQELLEMQ